VVNFGLSWTLISWAGIDGAALSLLLIALSIGALAGWRLLRELRAGAGPEDASHAF